MNYFEWSSRVDEVFSRGLRDGKIWRGERRFKAFLHVYSMANEIGIESFSPQIYQGACCRKTQVEENLREFYSQEVPPRFVEALERLEKAGI